MKHIKTPLRKIAGSLLAGVFMAGSAHAQLPSIEVFEHSLANGLTVNLTLPYAGTTNYFSGLQNIDVRIGGSSGSVTSFLAFCIDPFQRSPGSFQPYQLGNLNTPDTPTAYLGDEPTRTRISNLFSYAYEGTLGLPNDTNKLNAAAMQLALWEIINDDGALNSGSVQKTNSTSSGLVSATNALLAYNGTGGPQYNFTVYRSATAGNVAGFQDYIVATPVPEPGTYAMFLAGLGLMGVIARRRSAS